MPNPHPPAALLNDIATKTAAIAAHDPATAGPLWGAIHKLLLKAKADPAALAHVVATRDVRDLERMVRSLTGESVAGAASAPTPGAGPSPHGTVPSEASGSSSSAVRSGGSNPEAAGAVPTAAGDAPHAAHAPPAAFPAELLESALRAFRKRLKLTRLDHESKLSVRPLTSGRKHDVDAIMPPREFPRGVWDALVSEGKLVHVGQGFFALAEEQRKA